MNGFRLYDVDGVEMRLSERQAESLGVSPVSEPDESRPARNASKGDWVDYAERQGMTREAAEGHTRAQLIDLYG